MAEEVISKFSKSVDTYDDYALVQRLAAENLVLFLRDEEAVDLFYPGGSSLIHKTEPRVLELGAGTGILTGLLIDSLGEGKFICVDGSRAMLAKLKEKLPDRPGVEIKAYELDCNRLPEFMLDKSGKFDLIVSSFALQWIRDLPFLIRTVSSLLVPGGKFVFCLPASESFPEWKEACEVSNIAFTGNKLPELAALSNACLAACLNGVFKETLFTQRFKSCRDFFDSLKFVGATNRLAAAKTKPSSLSAGDFRRLIQTWDSLFECGSVEATYQVASAVLRKEK